MYITYGVLTLVLVMVGLISIAHSFGAFDPKEDD